MLLYQPLGRSTSMTEESFRLVVVSSRARNKLAIYASVLPHVVVMEYSYESSTLHDITDLIKKRLKKVSFV